MKRLGFALMASIVLVAGLGATAKVKGEGASAARPEPITAANVYEHEAHWPNIVALAEEWTPPGATSPLLPPTQGVLVRVEPDGMMRVDFGRHGKFDLPIAVSDLVSRANAVRTGKLHKHGPNFFLQIGTRLLDSSSERPRSIKSSAIADAKNYLVVFGNPDDDEFWQVTESLAALLSSGVASGETQPIYVPQAVTREDNQKVRDRIRASGWTVPYAYPRLSGIYTQSLLGSVPTVPHAILVTPEGRLLHRSDLKAPGAIDALRRVLESDG